MVYQSLITVATLAALVSAAQLPTPAADTKDQRATHTATETRHLKITLTPVTTTAVPGARVSLFVDVTPKPKMHVYAPDQKEYIPISLTLMPDDAFTAQPVKYPKPEKYFFAPLKETQLVYSKPFRIAQPVTVARTVTDPTLTVKGTLRYQACDDAICYVPQDIPVSWTIGLKR
jgi:DsbC/DsbD-like thiol-disulfide interchange protein